MTTSAYVVGRTSSSARDPLVAHRRGQAFDSSDEERVQGDPRKPGVCPFKGVRPTIYTEFPFTKTKWHGARVRAPH
jgi:hypothetical protein